MSSNLPPTVPVFPGMQFNSGFYTPNTEPITYEQMTSAFVEYPSAQGDISFRSADFSGNVVITGDLSVNGTINGSGGGGGGLSIITTSTIDVSNQITPAGNLALSTTTNYIDVITNTLNGVSYTALGSGLNNVCSSIAIDPSTGDVYAGGTFTEAGGTPINYLAKWNGTTWSVVGNKIFDAPITTVKFVRWMGYVTGFIYTCVTVLTTSSPPNVWSYSYAPEAGIINVWEYITTPGKHASFYTNTMEGFTSEPYGVIGYTTGDVTYCTGTPLYFQSENTIFVVSGGTNTIHAFESLQNMQQTTPIGFYAGSFNVVNQTQANNIVFSITTSGIRVALIAPLGGNGVQNATSNAVVYALALDNARNRLYVGGYFDTAGDVSANNIAYWDISLSNWFAMGNGVNAACRSLAFDSARDILYAVGDFTIAGSQPTARVAVWDATASQWLAMPTGFNDIARSIQYDPTTNTYGVVGDFTTAGTTTVNRIARMSSEYLENVNVQVNGTTVKTLAKNETGIIMVAGGNGYDMVFSPSI